MAKLKVSAWAATEALINDKEKGDGREGDGEFALVLPRVGVLTFHPNVRNRVQTQMPAKENKGCRIRNSS